jgi:GGDEF domain-containing protein
MADTFDSNNVYRIGGDEFVALCRGLSQSDAEDKVRELVAMVRKNGYEVAVGIAYSALPESLVGLVAYAEKEMYADKDRYYQSKGIESKAR